VVGHTNVLVGIPCLTQSTTRLQLRHSLPAPIFGTMFGSSRSDRPPHMRRYGRLPEATSMAMAWSGDQVLQSMGTFRFLSSGIKGST
jgi:hypothetical protein